jgi:hypothetical protein
VRQVHATFLGFAAATVLQPEQDMPGRSRKTNGARNVKNCLYKPDFYQGSTYPESFDLTYKEEVAGSIGRRPLRKSVVLQVKCSVSDEAPGIPEPLCSNRAAT